METPLIAIVDDDFSFLELLDDLLRDEGFRTLRQHMSVGAQVRLRAARPALVILDLWLERPDSGWRLLRELRHDPQTTAIPILVCSASPALAASWALPARWAPQAILSKPFDLDDLLTHVHRLHARAPTPGHQATNGPGWSRLTSGAEVRPVAVPCPRKGLAPSALPGKL